MNDNEKKQLAFISGILLKLVTNVEVTDNESQSLENIASDLGCFDLKESEFRW